MMLASPEASVMLRSPKVTDQHRGRGAIVYVRQSTTKQVQQHRESQRASLSERKQASSIHRYLPPLLWLCNWKSKA